MKERYQGKSITTYGILLNHLQEFLIIKNSEGVWQLPGGYIPLSDCPSLQLEVPLEVLKYVPSKSNIALYYPEYSPIYEESNFSIFKFFLEIEAYSFVIKLDDENCKFTTLAEFLEEPNKLHKNSTLIASIRDFYSLLDSKTILEKGWGDLTTSYHHKHNITPNPPGTEEALRQVWLLDLQWSNAPIELEREVSYIWSCWNLGNDYYYKKFNLLELQVEYGEDLPLINKYILEQIQSRNLSLKDIDDILVHWWW